MSKADRRNFSKGLGDLWDESIGKDGLSGWLGERLGIRDNVSGFFDKYVPWHRQIKPQDWQMMALSLFGPGAISALGSSLFTGSLGMMSTGLQGIKGLGTIKKGMEFGNLMKTIGSAALGVGQLGVGMAGAGAGAATWGASALPSIVSGGFTPIMGAGTGWLANSAPTWLGETVLKGIIPSATAGVKSLYEGSKLQGMLQPIGDFGRNILSGGKKTVDALAQTDVKETDFMKYVKQAGQFIKDTGTKSIYGAVGSDLNPMAWYQGEGHADYGSMSHWARLLAEGGSATGILESGGTKDPNAVSGDSFYLGKHVGDDEVVEYGMDLASEAEKLDAEYKALDDSARLESEKILNEYHLNFAKLQDQLHSLELNPFKATDEKALTDIVTAGSTDIYNKAVDAGMSVRNQWDAQMANLDASYKTLQEGWDDITGKEARQLDAYGYSL